MAANFAPYHLTDSEVDILQAFVDGETTTTFAKKTRRSKRSITFHLFNIYEKMGLQGLEGSKQVRAVVKALRAKVISL